MIPITALPHFNAAFNLITIIFLFLGLVFIKAGNRRRHRLSMLGAVAASVAFLVTYVIYHLNSGLARFGGEGFIRYVYFSILIAHVIIAVVITPLVPITLYRALTSQFERHRRLARWTWPLWMYVAISGVIVYVMAIHLYPFPGPPDA